MQFGLQLKHWLMLFSVGKLKIVLWSGTSHTSKHGGLQIVSGTTNITRLGKNPSPFLVGWMPNNRTGDGSLTTIDSRGSRTQLQPFTFINAVLILHLMWPCSFLTKWSHLSPLFNTCMSLPKFQQRYCVRWARLWTCRWHCPMWWPYTKPVTWDGDIPQCRSPNWWHSMSSVFSWWWQEPPCSVCNTPTMGTLSFHCGFQPR